MANPAALCTAWYGWWCSACVRPGPWCCCFCPSVSNDRSTFLGGGTNYGTGSTSDSFTQSPGGVTGWPVNSGSDTINGLVTGGNRTGDYAITKNSVDNLLNSTNRSEASQKNAAPGIKIGRAHV